MSLVDWLPHDNKYSKQISNIDPELTFLRKLADYDKFILFEILTQVFRLGWKQPKFKCCYLCKKKKNPKYNLMKQSDKILIEAKHLVSQSPNIRDDDRIIVMIYYLIQLQC